MSNGLILPFQATLDTEAEAFRIVVTGGGTAIRGIGLGTDRFGDTGQGVIGETDVGQGVTGSASGSGGIGVLGESQSGDGVWGESHSGDGVHGISHSVNSGVAGLNDNATGGTGVWGESHSGDGVHGLSRSAQSAGVSGKNDQGGTGVYAETSSHSGNALDIHGAIRVASSGDGTTPAAFRFTVSRDNIYPPIPAISPATTGMGATIKHPLIDGDPSALLFVTPVARQRLPELPYLEWPVPAAVKYGILTSSPDIPDVTDKWVLLATAGGPTPSLTLGDTFNILVIRTG